MFAYRHIQYLVVPLVLSLGIFSIPEKVQATSSGASDVIDFEFNGRIDADIVKYQRALKDQPDSVILHLQLGQLLLDQKGEVDKAIIQFQDAVKVEPTCGSCMVRLEKAKQLKESTGDELVLDANQYYVNKQYKRAEALYRIAIHNDPRNSQAHNCLSWTLYKEGSLEEGLSEIHEAMRLKANDPEYINTLGCLLYDNGNSKGALEAWQKAVSLSATPSPADLYGMAVALVSQGDKEQARKYFEQAIKEDSRYADLDYLSDKVGMSVKTLSMHDCLLSLTGDIPKDNASR
jgi:tetratricopeptide (TPR) repeat protein